VAASGSARRLRASSVSEENSVAVAAAAAAVALAAVAVAAAAARPPPEGAIDLALSQDQADILELVGALCARECPSSLVRASEALGFAPALWRSCAAIGLPGMAVAAERGGGGAGFLAAALAAEALGRALAPLPFAEHLAALRLLARELPPGAPELAPLLSGDAIAALALRPAEAGIAKLVPGGAVARALVALDGEELVWLDAEPPGRALPNLAAGPLADRSLAAGGGAAGRRVVLARGREAGLAYERARAEWRALAASALVGLAQGAFDLGLAYVAQREQFGVAIGSFQAIQHALADLAVALEGARLLARKAAWATEACDGERADAEPGAPREAARLASMAFLFASELAAKCAYQCLHYHGGYGVSQEYDIQLYYRRALGWALVLGEPGRELQALADTLYGEPGSAGAR